MITGGVYRLKNVYYTSYPYLKEESETLTIVWENNTINEYWDIRCVNGYYEIAPLSNPSLRLTVDELSVSNQPDQGTVKLIKANESDDQKWIILPIDEGYKIISKKDQTKCFEYGYGTLDNKAQLWKYVSSLNQKWEIEAVQTLSNGVYNVKNNYYQRYINYDGNEVGLISEPSTLLDNWLFESVGGYYKIRPTISSHTPLCVEEIYLSVNPAQGSICFVENLYGIHQLWIVVQLQNGAYRITSAMDPNKCFEFSYGNVYNEVQLWDYVEGSNQTWSLEPDCETLELSIENCYYKDNNNGFVSSDLSASPIKTMWYFKPYDGHYIIYNAENKRMAVSDSTNGSAVILVEGSDVHVQELWDVSILEGNLFKISPASIPDKCLEYSFGTGQTILQTWTYVNAENQTWILS